MSALSNLSLNIKTLVYAELLNTDKELEEKGSIKKTLDDIEDRIDDTIKTYPADLKEGLDRVSQSVKNLPSTTYDGERQETYKHLYRRLEGVAEEQLEGWDSSTDLSREIGPASKIIKNFIFSKDKIHSISEPSYEVKYGEKFSCHYNYRSHKVSVIVNLNLKYINYCTRLLPFAHEYIHAYTKDGSPEAGGYQPDWFREGVAVFMSEKAAVKLLTEAQLCLWHKFVKQAFLYPESGEETIYGEGNRKICKIYEWAEENDLKPKDFILFLMGLKGSHFQDGISLHDLVYQMVKDNDSAEEVLKFIQTYIKDNDSAEEVVKFIQTYIK